MYILIHDTYEILISLFLIVNNNVYIYIYIVHMCIYMCIYIFSDTSFKNRYITKKCKYIFNTFLIL